MKHVLIKRLTSLQEMLKANAKADWSENDPAEEFKALAKIVKGYLPTERDHAIDELSRLICNEDVESAYDQLIAQAELDGSCDAWTIVDVWEPFENDGWTVDDLLAKL